MVSKSLEKHTRDWEEMAKVDPLWAIISVPDKQFRGWDLESFFREGEREIGQVFANVQDLKYPQQHQRALDFGCGVGRLTRAISPHFKECYGVDVAKSMIDQAKELNQAFTNCRFSLISKGSFEELEDNHFDFIITRHVLQHLPSREMIRHYICELVRLLEPGGLLVFQLASHMPFRRRLHLRSKLYDLLQVFGFKHQFLYEKLTLHRIRMNYLTEENVALVIKSVGAKLLRTTAEAISRDGISANTYYVAR